MTAPKVTNELIDALIVKERYHQFPNTTVTVCCLTLKNGYNVIGESACVSVENFNEEYGKSAARDNARDKIWALEGYLLRENLWLEGNV